MLMNDKVSFFNFSLDKIVSDDLSIIDNARLRLLYYGLIISIFSLVILLIGVLYRHHFILSITIGTLLATSVILFKYFTYRPRWFIVSHLILIIGTFINIVNIYVAIQNVGIVTTEITILMVLFSFYMLGQRLGWFYSILNIVPVLTLLVLQYNNAYSLDLKPEKVGGGTVIIGMCASFLLIIFVHSHFYTAFIKTIRELKIINEEQSLLTVEFKKAIEKAQKSSEAKSEFLSTMSHEIRTPLNAVIGMSNLLIMGNPRPDQKENLDVLKFSAGNLLSIVNDVLDFNKIESGKLVFEKTRLNLTELMQNICGGQKLTAQRKGLAFNLDIDSVLNEKMVFGDPTRITQIIFNLISNAIKFTAQGNIWVGVKCVEERNSAVAVNFSVKDTGIGIEKENLGVIFEPFTQESITTTRQYGGTGLGLAIVKRLLELQGLKMHVSSMPNVGSEFSFTMRFPVSSEKATELAGEMRQQLSNQQQEKLADIHLLIAEDNLINVMLMKKLLSKWGITPIIAENGERAVELVQDDNFDIILMDLQMPVMNGFDAAMHIRRMHDPKKANIPIIALTASALFDIRERVHNAGMNDYVSKPFKPVELFDKIKGLVTAVSIGSSIPVIPL